MTSAPGPGSAEEEEAVIKKPIVRRKILHTLLNIGNYICMFHSDLDYIFSTVFMSLKTLWCFLFCKEDVTLLQGALKKLLNKAVIVM